MKLSTLLLSAIALLLAILSSSGVDSQDLDTNDFDITDLDIDTDYILLDDVEYDDDDQNDGDDDNILENTLDNDLDIRSVHSDDLLSLSDDVLRDDFEKRSWKYKCEQRECNARCLALLNLPQGTCGAKGKCYCKRVK